MDIALTLQEPELVLGARPGGFLRCRLVSGDAETRTPVAPDSLRSTLDMSLMRLGVNGEVSYCGVLPPAGSLVGVLQSGYLPVSVWCPESPQRFLLRVLPLGELRLPTASTPEVPLYVRRPPHLASSPPLLPRLS